MDSGVILVGMMGSGKSTVGRALADMLGVPFQDTDMLLEHRLGRQIPQLFKLYGEVAFRAHETSILESLEPEPRVLATGGGIILREENWVEFKRLGRVVFLDVPVELLTERLEVSNRKRPLLQTENWTEKLKELYEFRRPLYERADMRIEIDESPIEHVAQRLFEVLQA
jgi:shikimate kinase